MERNWLFYYFLTKYFACALSLKTFWVKYIVIDGYVGVLVTSGTRCNSLYGTTHTKMQIFRFCNICLLASLLDNDTGGHVSASLNGFTNCTSTHEVKIIIIKKSEIKYRDNDAYLVTELVEIVLFVLLWSRFTWNR